MSSSYLGEIRMFGFGARVPRGWLACNGALISIAENTALYTLLGTIYGGDGVQTFALPDFRGRIPLSQGQGPGLSNRVIGERSGTESVTVLSTQMPAHAHAAVASSATATVSAPGSTVLPGAVSADTLYTSDTSGLPAKPMASASIGNAGGTQPHENCMPTLTVQYCISVAGIFPSRN